MKGLEKGYLIIKFSITLTEIFTFKNPKNSETNLKHGEWKASVNSLVQYTI